MSKKYKFSIVMAVYNMESYVKEAVDSLINQTIGFEDNLQILLVNDGSIDNSGTICQSYADRYPENIVYISKENGGVSDARNKGLEYVTGELVNFLDADDKLLEDALEKVYHFYEKNKEEVDLISIPLWFFEGKEGEHVLNYKFYKTRVVDIWKEPRCFQMHISSSFIKLEEIKKYRFNTCLKLGEDAEVANKVILNKGRYGVISDTKYLYRKRNTGDSVIQGAKLNKENYIPPVKYLHLELFRFAREKYNKVPEYLQWMFVYDIGGKIVVPHISPSILGQVEIDEFLNYVKQALQDVNDGIILGRTDLRRFYNLYLLNLKYDGFKKENYNLITNKEDVILCIDKYIVDMLYRQKIHVKSIEKQGDNLRISGYFNFLFDNYDFKILLENNGDETELVFKESQNYQVTSLNYLVASGYEFDMVIPFNQQSNQLKAKAVVGNSKVQISLLLETDENADIAAVSELGLDNYIVKGKNKSITITNAVRSKTDEKISDETEQKKIENIEANKKSKFLKLYIKNTIFPKCIVPLLNVIEITGNKKLLKKVTKEIPANYRYYLMELKKNKDSKLNIATSINQACIFNGKGLLLAKMTDAKVNIEKYEFTKSSLILKGGILSPFKAEQYKLSYCCNNIQKDCELKLNGNKSIKLHGEYVVECNEFMVEIPLEEKMELYFEITMEYLELIVPIEMDEYNFIKNSNQKGYTVKVTDKKKIELFSA